MTDVAKIQAFLTSTLVEPYVLQTAGLPPGVIIHRQRLHLRPGIDVSVLYRIQVSNSANKYVVVSSATAGKLKLDTPVGKLSAWQYPHDPKLPSLPTACNAEIVARWVGAKKVSLQMLSYRPMSRAVLRVTDDKNQVWYLKILPTHLLTELLNRHQLLGPIAPKVIGTPANGVLVTAAVSGVSLARCYVNWHHDKTALPAVETICGLLDNFPVEVMDLDPHKAWCDRLDFYTTGAITALPQHSDKISQLSNQISKLLQTTHRGQLVPSHGDFYEANIFVYGSKANSVIDLDAVGPGYRVDDYACLLGHLAVLPGVSNRHYPRANQIINTWLPYFDTQVDPVSLRARTAGIIISLMVGTDQTQATSRLNLAINWLQEAYRSKNLGNR